MYNATAMSPWTSALSDKCKAKEVILALNLNAKRSDYVLCFRGGRGLHRQFLSFLMLLVGHQPMMRLGCGLCLQNIDTIIGSIIKAIDKTFVLKERESSL